MDGDVAPAIGCSQVGMKRSCRHFVMEEDVLEEPHSDFDENTCDRLYEDVDGESLYSCCPAEGSIDQYSQAGPGSVLEFWVDQDSQRWMDCPVSPLLDICSPATSISPPTSAATSPGCWEQDPVNAAAHLHLLGESLCLIGHHLQETTKMVRVSSSVSLLLDSLLCALAPLLCLTAEIPELRSCTQHSLASTLENISYVMPGM